MNFQSQRKCDENIEFYISRNENLLKSILICIFDLAIILGTEFFLLKRPAFQPFRLYLGQLMYFTKNMK